MQNNLIYIGIIRKQVFPNENVAQFEKSLTTHVGLNTS